MYVTHPKSCIRNNLGSIILPSLKTKFLRLLLYFLLLNPVILNSPAYASDLSIPVGSIGYLGEIPAPVGSVSLDYAILSPVLSANTPLVRLSGYDRNGGIASYKYYKEIGRVGIPIYNQNDPNGSFIVLAPSGFLMLRYQRANSKYETASVVFNRSISSSMVNFYNDGMPTASGGTYTDLNWGLLPRSGNQNFFASSNTNKNHHVTATISTYSAYAIGPLKAGQYTMYRGTSAYFYLRTSSGSFTRTPDILNTSMHININALKSCSLTPQTNTNIQFPSQLAQTYSTPTKLADNLASVNVNCPYSGNVHLTLSPFNQLVQGSSTGMVLAGLNQSSGSSLPYVVPSLKEQQQAICQPNAPEAVSFVGSTKLPTQTQKDFNQTLHFNLCANGKIAPDLYKGSANVSILIE